MTSTPDARLVEAHDLALTALAEITPRSTIGEAVGYAVEDDGVVSLRFANRMSGYPGWFWTVSVAAAAEDAEPTVLEAELMPGEGALIAPDWVPWATRLADYHAAQAALAATAVGEAAEGDDLLGDADGLDDSDDDDLDDDDLDDEDDLDDDDADEDDDAEELDSDGSPRLHAGDVDGVDIDELDEDADDDADEDDDDADEADDADDDDDEDPDEDPDDDLDEDDQPQA